MRLSAEVLDHIKKWYAKCEEADCMPENGLTIGRLLDTIEALQQENEQLRKERDQAIRDIDKGNCRSCVYDGKKICYGNMHGKDREVAKEQGLPYCIGWQWRGLEGRE